MKKLSGDFHSSEHAIQCAVVMWARAMIPQFPELAWLYATPNGGVRNITVAIKLKREGVQRGVPDLFLPVPKRNFHGLFIEMKSLSGRLAPDQARWLDALNERGYMAVVCRGSQAAIDTIKSYLDIKSKN